MLLFDKAARPLFKLGFHVDNTNLEQLQFMALKVGRKLRSGPLSSLSAWYESNKVSLTLNLHRQLRVRLRHFRYFNLLR